MLDRLIPHGAPVPLLPSNPPFLLEAVDDIVGAGVDDRANSHTRRTSTGYLAPCWPRRLDVESGGGSRRQGVEAGEQLGEAGEGHRRGGAAHLRLVAAEDNGQGGDLR